MGQAASDRENSDFCEADLSIAHALSWFGAFVRFTGFRKGRQGLIRRVFPETYRKGFSALLVAEGLLF